MAAKENFNKAVFDMFGVGNRPEESAAPAAAAPSAPSNPSAAPTAAPTAAPAAAAPASRPAAAPMPVHTPPVHIPTTYLAPGSYMEGKLKVKGDVEVAGDFKGDMAASGNITLRSNITSNITAAKVDILSCTLTGDIHASSSVEIDEKSTIEGNVFAQDLVCAGKVKGDIQVTGNATFQKASQVEGNITTGTMSMECGAVISGTLVMKGEAEKKHAAPGGERSPATGK